MMDLVGNPMDKKQYVIHPLRFAMWLFLLTIIMIFGSLTSAYLVNKSFLAQPLVYDLPSVLWTNLILILFSSIPMQYAVWAGKRGENGRAQIALGMTLILGILFLYGQYQAWGDMVDSGLPMVDWTRTDSGSAGRMDNTVSFFYIFTGLHALHLFAGLIALIVSFAKTGLGSFKPGKQGLNFELTATFWHFLGALWLYLFIFLKYTQT